MPRRASSGIKPGLLIGVGVAVVALFFGGKALLNHKPAGLEGGAPLAIEDYKEHGNNLRGNTYVVEGTVDETRTSDNSRVVFLKVKGSGSAEEYVGVKIPNDLPNVQNIEREQRYSFKVKIEKQGVLVATAVNRL